MTIKYTICDSNPSTNSVLAKPSLHNAFTAKDKKLRPMRLSHSLINAPFIKSSQITPHSLAASLRDCNESTSVLQAHVLQQISRLVTCVFATKFSNECTFHRSKYHSAQRSTPVNFRCFYKLILLEMPRCIQPRFIQPKP